MNFSSNYRKPDNAITEERLEEFMTEIKAILTELYNPELSFVEATDLPY